MRVGVATAGVVILLVGLGITLRLQHMHDVASRTPDERIYTYYAHRVAEKGFSEFPALTKEYSADKAAWVYPPPTRIGYLAPLAVAMRIFDVNDERVGAWLSCFASITSLLLVALIGARFLPLWVTAYALFFLAVSALDLTIARRCWQDGWLSVLTLIMIYAVCELTRHPRELWAYASLILAGSFGMLVKETIVLVYAGCIAFVIVGLVQRKAWRAIAKFLFAVVIAATLCLLVLIWAAGGFSALLMLLQAQGSGFRNNPYGLENLTGPWINVIKAFWILSPVNLLLGVAGLLMSVKIVLLRLFSWICALSMALFLFAPVAQNFRYVTTMYGAMYLVGGFGLWAILERIESRKVIALIALLLIGAGIRDYFYFERVFVNQGTPDLAIRLVLDQT